MTLICVPSESSSISSNANVNDSPLTSKLTSSLLTVTDTEIKAWIDSAKVVDFTIDDKKLSIRPEVELLKPFGIASWNTTAALRNIRVKKIVQLPDTSYTR